MKTEAEIGVTRLKAKEDKEPLDAERGLGQRTPQSLQQEPALPTPELGLLAELGENEVLLLKVPRLWCLAPAAPGHECRSPGTQ